MIGYSERRWTSKDGLTLFARDYSGESGPARLPVICLHGLTRNSSDFEQVAPFIAGTGRRVIVPDVRGRGLSAWDPNPDNYTPRIYARDTLEMLNALGIARAVFLGTSMGGIIMMVLAAGNRRRISASVLNDVGPEVSPDGLARIQTYVGRPVDVTTWSEAVEYVRQISGVALPNLSDAEWERFTKRTFDMTDHGPRPRYDPSIAAPLQRGKAKTPSWLAWILFKRLAHGKPTLVIRGAHSDILSHETALKMARIAPTASLVEVSGVGHAPLLEEPISEEALKSFLDKIA